ncbi:MAG: MotA/TolQ/ExbB proton channel family protein [Spirochaetota bacterium]
MLNAPFFVLLLLLSICSVSLIIEKLLLLRRWRRHNRKLSGQIRRLLEEDKPEELGALLKKERGAEAILLRRSFYFIHHETLDHDEPILGNEGHLFELKKKPTYGEVHRLEKCLGTCIESLGLQLEKHCNLFHLIANVSTLLGLLGTVTGMIYAFQNGVLEQNTQLAQGISQALITTAGGLIVAIPALISQQLFLNSSALRRANLEQLGHDILLFMQRKLPLLEQGISERKAGAQAASRISQEQNGVGAERPWPPEWSSPARSSKTWNENVSPLFQGSLEFFGNSAGKPRDPRAQESARKSRPAQESVSQAVSQAAPQAVSQAASAFPQELLPESGAAFETPVKEIDWAARLARLESVESGREHDRKLQLKQIRNLSKAPPMSTPLGIPSSPAEVPENGRKQPPSKPAPKETASRETANRETASRSANPRFYSANKDGRAQSAPKAQRPS